MKWPYSFNMIESMQAFYERLKQLFSDVGSDMQEQKTRVDNLINGVEQPSEVVDMHLGRDGQTYPVARDMVLGEIGKTESAQAAINADTAAQLATEIQNRTDADSSLTAQLADLSQQKADNDYVTTLINSVASGGPKDVFYTLAALQSAYPSGTDGTFLVLDTDPTVAHSYAWNGSDWQDLGPYQGIEPIDKSISESKLADEVADLLNNAAIIYDMTNEAKKEIGNAVGGTNYGNTEGFIMIPSGQSGYGNFLRYRQSMDNKYFGKKIRAFFLVSSSNTEIDNTKLAIYLTGYSNPQQTVINSNFYLFSIDFTVSGSDIAPYLQVNNQTALSNQCKITVVQVAYQILSSVEDIYNFNSDVFYKKTGKIESESKLDAINEKLKIDMLLLNPTVQGSQNNGGTVDTSNNTINAVSGTTSLGTSIQYRTPVSLTNYVGKTVKIGFKLQVNGIDKLSIFAVRLNAKVGTSIISNVGTVIEMFYDDDYCYATIEYIIPDGLTELHPYFQITGSDVKEIGYSLILKELNFGLTSNNDTLSYKLDDFKVDPIIPVTRMVPSPSMLNQINTPYRVLALSIDGVLYGRDGSGQSLCKSTDWGANWTNLFTFSEPFINQVMLTTSGRIVIALSTGKILTSDTSGANFTQTLDIAPNYVHELFGMTVTGNEIALSEYGQRGVATSAWHSVDAGQTWTRFFQNVDNADGFHIHDIEYDPYEDMFWISSGDGDLRRMIFYTKDRGANWYQATAFGSFTAPQVTELIILPECILGVTDSPEVGVIRYTRPDGGTPLGGSLEFEKVMSIAEWGDGEVPIGAKAVTIKGADASAFFGWNMPDAAKNGGNALKNAQVYATRDGHEFFNIYKADQPATLSGYDGTYGPDNNGNFVVVTLDKNLGTNACNILKFNTNMWQPR